MLIWLDDSGVHFKSPNNFLWKTVAAIYKIKLFILEVYVWKFMLIDFYKNKLLHMYFLKIMQTFYGWLV